MLAVFFNEVVQIKRTRQNFENKPVLCSVDITQLQVQLLYSYVELKENSVAITDPHTTLACMNHNANPTQL
jgi:hypothetical protein